MKKLIVIIILLTASVNLAGNSRISKIINWINNQNYTKVQLQNNLTWPKLEAAAENRNIDPNSIKSYWHTIANSVWSDYRPRRLEEVCVILENEIRKSVPAAVVTTFSYGPSSTDPNNMAAFYLAEIPLNLERN